MDRSPDDAVLPVAKPVRPKGSPFDIDGNGHRRRTTADHRRRRPAPGGAISNPNTVTLAQPHPAAVELTVADTGIGIPDDEHRQIFTRFYRSSRTRDHGIPGAGLGLALSRAIIDAAAAVSACWPTRTRARTSSSGYPPTGHKHAALTLGHGDQLVQKPFTRQLTDAITAALRYAGTPPSS